MAGFQNLLPNFYRSVQQTHEQLLQCDRDKEALKKANEQIKHDWQECEEDNRASKLACDADRQKCLDDNKAHEQERKRWEKESKALRQDIAEKEKQLQRASLVTPAALKDLDEARKLVADLQEQNAGLTRMVRNSDTELEKRQQRIDTLNAQYTACLDRVDRRLAAAAHDHARITATQNQLTSSQSQLTDAQNQLSAAQHELDKLTGERRQLEDDNKAFQLQVENDRDTKLELKTKLQLAEARGIDKIAEIDRLATEVMENEEEIRNKDVLLTATQNQLTTAQSQLDKINVEHRRLEEDNKALRLQVESEHDTNVELENRLQQAETHGIDKDVLLDQTVKELELARDDVRAAVQNGERQHQQLHEMHRKQMADYEMKLDAALRRETPLMAQFKTQGQQLTDAKSRLVRLAAQARRVEDLARRLTAASLVHRKHSDQ